MPTELPDWAIAQRRAVGNRVRQLREQRNIAADALGIRAGLGKNAVTRIELALNAPTLDTLLLIAHSLGVHPSELFAGIPPGPGETPPGAG